MLCRLRDANGLLRLCRRHGVTNEVLSYWTHISTGEISRRITGNEDTSNITKLERWERIADALNMPDHARTALGLAARTGSRTTYPATVPSGTAQTAARAVTGSGPAHGLPPGGVDDASLVAVMAAESARFGRWAEVTNVGVFTVEQLHADLRQLAQAYLTQPPLPVLLGLRNVRDEAFALLSGRQHPGQARDLYAVGGYACTLLAWISSDLDQFAAADTQARTAWLFAELADSLELRAWALSTRSKIAFWVGRYRDAVAYAQQGQQYAPPTSVAVLLAAQQADAWSEIGVAARAREAVEAARTARDQITDADDVGGLLSCSLARQANYAAGVYLRVGDTDAALDEADTALNAYEISQQRSYGTEAQLHITRAASYLVKNELDGVSEALRPVLSLPADQRLCTVTRRVGQIGLALTQPRLARSADAAALRAEIDSYRTHTAATALPAQIHHPGRTPPVPQREQSPEQFQRMRDHWWWRPGWKAGRSFYTWHLTFDSATDVHRLAHDYLSNLDLPALDHVPDRWLHLTMQAVGFTDEVPTTEVDRIVEAVRQRCATLEPFEIALGPAVVDPEVVRLTVTPAHLLANLRRNIRQGVADVWGAENVPEPADGFQPHVSLAYSSGTGPAEPVLRAVAIRTPRTAMHTVTEAQLIVLNRDHRQYQWTTHAVVLLGQPEAHGGLS